MGQRAGLLGLVSCDTLEFCCACVVFAYKTCLDRCEGHSDGGENAKEDADKALSVSQLCAFSLSFFSLWWALFVLKAPL